MKEKMVIAQLRGTIFATLNISYTPENYSKFRELLLPGAEAFNANPSGAIIPGVNPNTPQYGLPWRLFKKCERIGEYNIVFLPGKIDIILTKDTPFGDDTESLFCKQCIEWFTKIQESQGHVLVNRIAYAPLYAIKLDNMPADAIWGGLLKKTMYDGTPLQDINFSFLLKRQIKFDDLMIQMNLLHNFTDGMQIKQDGAQQIMYKVVLLQLDLNSIPEVPLSLDTKGVAIFFSRILDLKDSLIDNVAI